MNGQVAVAQLAESLGEQAAGPPQTLPRPLMAPPIEVRVGPYRYEVAWDAQALTEFRRDSGRDLMGRCDQHRQRIVLDPTAGPDERADTLLHEALHCVWRAAGADPDRKVTQEEAISILSPGLLDVLRRNPVLVQYLIQGMVGEF